MCKAFHKLALLTLLMLPCVPLAVAAPATDSHYTQNGFNPRMLDSSVPQAERIKLFAQLVNLANQGQVRAQELAGTIYWQGQKTPGSPVQQNFQQARILLANASAQGDVPAMAKLSELELADGRTFQAMIWAQLYAHYLNPLKSARSTHGIGYAYAMDLIDRIIKAGGENTLNDKVARSVNALVAKFNEQIRHGIDVFKKQSRSGSTHLITGPSGPSLRGELSKLSGEADYIVAFDASGTQKGTWLIASYPTSNIATLMQSRLEHVRANPVAEGSSLRYLQVRVRLNGLKKRSLRPHH